MILSSEEMLAAIVFGAVKFVGYYFVARRVAHAYLPQRQATPLIVALARIALGAVLAGLVASTFDVHKTLPWYLVLVGMRLVEWAMVFVLCYEQTLTGIRWPRLARHASFGALVSCLLDLPAAFTAIAIPLMAYGIC